MTQEVPLKYLTLTSNVYMGPVSVKITEKQSFEQNRTFIERVIRKNSLSVSTNVSVTAIIEFFNISNKMELAIAETTTTETKVEQVSIDNLARVLSSKSTIEYNALKNEFFACAAEMVMYAFNDDGYIMLPTGRMIYANFNASMLQQPIVLDDTWESTVRLIDGGNVIKCNSTRELRRKIENIPNNIGWEIPDPRQGYFIKSVSFPGNMLIKWGEGDRDVGVGLLDVPSIDQQWRFVQYRYEDVKQKVFQIYNQKYTHARFTQLGKDSSDSPDWGTSSLKISKHELWKLEYQPNNKVKIVNYESGLYLAKVDRAYPKNFRRGTILTKKDKISADDGTDLLWELCKGDYSKRCAIRTEENLDDKS